MNHPLRHHRAFSRACRRSEAPGGLRTMVRVLAVACVIAWLVPVVSAQSPADDVEGKSLADGIAAIVNSEIITVSELQTEMADAILRLKARYEGDELTEHLVQKRYEIVTRMIEHKLQLQEAKAKNVVIGDEEVETAWEKLHDNPVALPPSASRSKAALREEMMVRRARDIEIHRGILVTPEEIRTYYTAQQQKFTSPTQHHIRQILLLPKLGENRETLKTRADVLMSQLNESTNFEKLAELFSDGAESVLGGDLGFVTKAELLAPLGEALDKLAPGEVSPLIETEIGIHILRLEETRQGTVQSFDAVKEAIAKQLHQEKIQRSHEAWMSSLKDKAYIEIRFPHPDIAYP